MKLYYILTILILKWHAFACADESIIIAYHPIEEINQNVVEWVVPQEKVTNLPKSWPIPPTDALDKILENHKQHLLDLNYFEILSLPPEPPFSHENRDPLDFSKVSLHLQKIVISEIDKGKTTANPYEWVRSLTQVAVIKLVFSNREQTLQLALYALPNGEFIKKNKRKPTELELERFRLLPK